MCWKFVWPSKHPPIAWTQLCRPIEDGGLGLKNLKSWNEALICKTLWKIHMKKDSMWIRWVNHMYISFGNVWQWTWRGEDSPLVKQILCTRNKLVRALWSVHAAATCLDGWFNGRTGLRHAYQFFANSVGRWPWKPLLAKSFILRKHRIALWSSVSTRIWDGIRKWGMRKSMGSSTAVLKVFRGVYRVYTLWNARNGAVFESQKPDAEAIVKNIKIL
ncbi:uncharacterized protein LOC142547687 isoform X2 [Primulina tabacum]|uniref:uncharacterized protein LOC142547687 isoform X2 n=1 Tax=Primulina tabacum TaxID=48773 RepID=UPI003F5A3419